ncbi:hypothetical protein BJY16_000646 [Actinoplanes octamycinicus]|uniref:Pyrrolo-quinoline quinone repeat domain-containing protein n=1 Tax=Actinoplanes octamycinicus TaxID=135948 RepID=A0A7W7GRZ0_9ACTN|nr:PQQ-binding-like beta-propeller repeat protein [Actinoplanes octamycinicus]MBB4737187.1 hypothetical protein [Actinoplanes octamycinicus]GIE61993.1 hypothetical protein Aoc01nite_73950 [Actinoplanes octamycinicus]
MTTIDLGDVSEPALPEPADAARPAQLRRRDLSRAAAAVLAVLCAIGLTGSARPGPPLVHELWSMPVPEGGYPEFADGQAVLFRTGPDGAALSAYDLADGRVRWTTRIGPEPTWMITREPAHRLYVTEHMRVVEENNAAAQYATDTVVLDSRTGAVQWRHAGQMMAGDATTALFADWDDRARITGLHLVRAVDGAPVWDRVIDPAVTVVAPDQPATPEQVVTVTAAGLLTSYRYADGRPLASRQAAPVTGEPWLPMIADGRFADIRYGAESTVTMYRTDTLTELWHRSGLGPDVNALFCGPVLCLGDRETLHAVDVRSGADLWTARQTGALPIGAGRLLINSGGADSSRVVDATAGIAGNPWIDGTVLFPPRPDGTLLVLRAYGYPDLRKAVLRLDPATGRTEVLGSIDALEGNCQPVARYLVCMAGGDDLSVTAVG